MTIYVLNDVDITGQQFTCNEITYPSNWLELSTTEEKESLGVKCLNVVYPELTDDTKKYCVTFIDDFEKGIRTYNIVDKTVDEMTFDNSVYNQRIMREILELEQDQPEIIRDFLLGVKGSRTKLQELKDKIDALKLQLK